LYETKKIERDITASKWETEGRDYKQKKFKKIYRAMAIDIRRSAPEKHQTGEGNVIHGNDDALTARWDVQSLAY
jgi:hypothetical protein